MLMFDHAVRAVHFPAVHAVLHAVFADEQVMCVRPVLTAGAVDNAVLAYIVLMLIAMLIAGAVVMLLSAGRHFVTAGNAFDLAGRANCITAAGVHAVIAVLIAVIATNSDIVAYDAGVGPGIASADDGTAVAAVFNDGSDFSSHAVTPLIEVE